jgi:transcriptional regulator with XRE-family HTH domain
MLSPKSGGPLIGHYAFGSKLRMQRERQGVSLASIAESTKIKLSLLDALERGDVSQWPRGLFRRAYLRDYAAAIGVPAEPLVAEFTRWFPEDGPPVAPANLAEEAEPLRLNFPSAAETGPFRPFEPLAATAAELLLVVAIGLLIALARGVNPLTTCGVVALVYYPLATILTGRVLSNTKLRWLLAQIGARTHTASAAQATLYLVPKPSSLPLVALGTEDEEAAATTRRTAAV